MKLAKGIQEDGVFIGNHFDKYGSRNPIVRGLMRGFENSLLDLISRTSAEEIHEVGCGEGYWTLQLYHQKMNVRGSDFSEIVVDMARDNAKQQGITPDIFIAKDIYELSAPEDQAQLVICCEVLEHLEHPEKAMQVLQEIANPHVILSVPREPIWSLMNLARGKYWQDLGNTPGHINRWSKNAFINLVSRYFTIEHVHTPLPWTMVWAKSKKNT